MASPPLRSDRSSGPAGSEDRLFARLLDTVEDVLFVFDDEDNLLLWNRRVNEVTGYTDEEIAELSPLDFVAERDRPRVREKIRHILETGSARVETRYLTKSGREIPYEFTGALIAEEDRPMICGVGRDVSVRKTHERKLRESKRRFKTLVESVENYAIFLLDEEGAVSTWNRGARSITGYEQEEVLGRFFGLFYPEEARREDVPATRLREAGRRRQIEKEGWRVRKDGSRFWARATLTAVRDETGQLSGFSKVVRDLTDQRQWRKKLEESEAKYHRLFENAREGIIIARENGRVIDINPAGRSILGYSARELNEMAAGDLYLNPEDQTALRDLIDSERPVEDEEIALRRSDGKEIICRLSVTQARLREDAGITYYVLFRDVTREANAIRELEASERRYRRLFERSRDAVVLTEPQGAILDANRAAQELFGYPRSELLQLDAGDLYAEPDHRTEHILPTLLNLEGSEILEATMQRKNGTEFLASASVSVHRSEDGEVEFIQALVRDITDQRLLEKEFVNIQERERRRIGRELHDGVSSQLAGVAMMTNGLVQDLEDGREINVSELREIHELIRESAHQTRALSHGLSPMWLREQGLPAGLKSLAEQARAHEEIDCTVEASREELPLADEVAIQLYRIAQEAVNNALQHADPDSIILRLFREEQCLVLKIEDDGAGLGNNPGEEAGLGLRTMRYRARLIGSELEIGPGSRGGTRVTCRIRTFHRE